MGDFPGLYVSYLSSPRSKALPAVIYIHVSVDTCCFGASAPTEPACSTVLAVTFCLQLTVLTTFALYISWLGIANVIYT